MSSQEDDGSDRELLRNVESQRFCFLALVECNFQGTGAKVGFHLSYPGSRSEAHTMPRYSDTLHFVVGKLVIETHKVWCGILQKVHGMSLHVRMQGLKP